MSTGLSRTRLIAAAVGFACLPGLAMAAAVDTPRIGAAAGLKGQVTAVIDSQAPRAVRNGDAILGGERIKTGPGGSLMVEFLDNSTFQIGPNADVVINPSAVQPVAGASVRSVMVNAGAFRSITALASTNSQTIISTSVGAFTSSAGVVVGQVTPQRLVLFPIDGPGNFVYSAKSLTVPKGGALIADVGTGSARAVPAAAADPATTALMAEAMTQLGGSQTAAQQAAGASTPVGYVTQPTGAVAGIATLADGYLNTAGGAQSKEEIPPETQVAAAQQPPSPPSQPPPAGPNISPPPLPPPVPSCP